LPPRAAARSQRRNRHLNINGRDPSDLHYHCGISPKVVLHADDSAVG
jgi:hypothetical protein